jgi:hypothetical protein
MFTSDACLVVAVMGGGRVRGVGVSRGHARTRAFGCDK